MRRRFGRSGHVAPSFVASDKLETPECRNGAHRTRTDRTDVKWDYRRANARGDAGVTSRRLRTEDVATRVRTTLINGTSIRAARGVAGKKRWREALMMLDEAQRSTAQALYKEESRPAGSALARRIGAEWHERQRVELVNAWLTLSAAERQRAERELPEGLRAEVLAAVRTEERRRKAWTRAERAQALQDDVGPVPGRVHRAACSGLSRQDMRLAGLSKSECDEAMSMRKSAMTLTAAAEYIAVPKGRLDRWERSGLAKCSFTRKISMAKMVTARFWTKRDADWIKGRVPMLEAHDAARRKRARREGKKAPGGG